MRLYSYTIVLLLFAIPVLGQRQTQLVFDTSNAKQVSNNDRYSKTDSLTLDTLALWNYKLDAAEKWKNDIVKPLGGILLWRIKPIDDKISKDLYGHPWTPSFRFVIYNLSDSSWCYKLSDFSRKFSSCRHSEPGSDTIQIGKYLFLHESVCLACERYDTKVDYCRPVINAVFSALRGKQFGSLQELTAAFIIQKGEISQTKENNELKN